MKRNELAYWLSKERSLCIWCGHYKHNPSSCKIGECFDEDDHVAIAERRWKAWKMGYQEGILWAEREANKQALA